MLAYAATSILLSLPLVSISKSMSDGRYLMQHYYYQSQNQFQHRHIPGGAWVSHLWMD